MTSKEKIRQLIREKAAKGDNTAKALLQKLNFEEEPQRSPYNVLPQYQSKTPSAYNILGEGARGGTMPQTPMRTPVEPQVSPRQSEIIPETREPSQKDPSLLQRAWQKTGDYLQRKEGEPLRTIDVLASGKPLELGYKGMGKAISFIAKPATSVIGYATGRLYEEGQQLKEMTKGERGLLELDRKKADEAGKKMVKRIDEIVEGGGPILALGAVPGGQYILGALGMALLTKGAVDTGKEIGTVYEQANQQGVNYPKLRSTDAAIKKISETGWKMLVNEEEAKELSQDGFTASFGLALVFGLARGTIRQTSQGIQRPTQSYYARHPEKGFTPKEHYVFDFQNGRVTQITPNSTQTINIAPKNIKHNIELTLGDSKGLRYASEAIGSSHKGMIYKRAPVLDSIGQPTTPATPPVSLAPQPAPASPTISTPPMIRPPVAQAPVAQAPVASEAIPMPPASEASQSILNKAKETLNQKQQLVDSGRATPEIIEQTKKLGETIQKLEQKITPETKQPKVKATEIKPEKAVKVETYHITQKENIPSIEKTGLKPSDNGIYGNVTFSSTSESLSREHIKSGEALKLDINLKNPLIVNDVKLPIQQLREAGYKTFEQWAKAENKDGVIIKNADNKGNDIILTFKPESYKIKKPELTFEQKMAIVKERIASTKKPTKATEVAKVESRPWIKRQISKSEWEALEARKVARNKKAKSYSDYLKEAEAKKAKPKETPEQIRARLAKEKAEVAAKRAKQEGAVIAKPIEKPKSTLEKELIELKKKGKDEAYFHDLHNKKFLEFVEGKSKVDESVIVSKFIDKNFGAGKPEKYPDSILKSEDFLTDQFLDLPGFVKRGVPIEATMPIKPGEGYITPGFLKPEDILSRSQVPDSILNFIELFKKLNPELTRFPVIFSNKGISPGYMDPSLRIVINPKQLQKDFDTIKEKGKIKLPNNGVFHQIINQPIKESYLKYLDLILEHEMMHAKVNLTDEWYALEEALRKGDKVTKEKVGDRMEQQVYDALQKKESLGQPISFEMMKELRGKYEVSKQHILNLINQYKKKGMTPYSEEVIRSSLQDKGDKINVNEFIKDIHSKNSYIQLSSDKTSKYKEIQFSQEAQGYLDKNPDAYVTNIFRLPFSYHGNFEANLHYSQYPDYFGHMRGFRKDNTLYINEIQSDLIQGNEWKKVEWKNISKEKADKIMKFLSKNWENRILQETIQRLPNDITSMAVKKIDINKVEKRLRYPLTRIRFDGDIFSMAETELQDIPIYGTNEKISFGPKLEWKLAMNNHEGDLSHLTLISKPGIFLEDSMFVPSTLASNFDKLHYLPIPDSSNFSKFFTEFLNSLDFSKLHLPEETKNILLKTKGETNKEILKNFDQKMSEYTTEFTDFIDGIDVNKFIFLKALIKEGGISTASEMKQAIKFVLKNNLPVNIKKYYKDHPTQISSFEKEEGESLKRYIDLVATFGLEKEGFIKIQKQGDVNIYTALPQAEKYPEPEVKKRRDINYEKKHKLEGTFAIAIKQKLLQSKDIFKHHDILSPGNITNFESIAESSFSSGFIFIEKGTKIKKITVYNPKEADKVFIERYNEIVPKALKRLGENMKEEKVLGEEYNKIDIIKEQEDVLFIPGFSKKIPMDESPRIIQHNIEKLKQEKKNVDELSEIYKKKFEAGNKKEADAIFNLIKNQHGKQGIDKILEMMTLKPLETALNKGTVYGLKYVYDKIAGPQIVDSIIHVLQKSRIVNKLGQGIIFQYRQPEIYKELSRLAEREIIRSETIAEEMMKVLSEGLNEEQLIQLQQAIINNGYHPDPNIGDRALMARRILDDYGEQFMRAGAISRETFEKNKGEYLQRVYYSKQLQSSFSEFFSSGGQKASLQRAKKRGIEKTVTKEKAEKMIEEGWEDRGEIKSRPGYQKVWRDFTEGERKQMGEITDAPDYLVAKTIRDVAYDVAILNKFDKLSELKDYVKKQPYTNPKTNEEFIKVPDSPQYGKIRNKYIDPYIWADIKALMETRTLAKTLAQKALRTWKQFKVTNNPATHFRNMYFNFILGDIAGLSPLRVDVYGSALYELIKGTGDYKEARIEGLFGTTWTGSELSNVLEAKYKLKTANLKMNEKTGIYEYDWKGKIGNTILDSVEVVANAYKTFQKDLGRIYQGEEMWQKLSLYKYAKYELGMNNANAAKFAKKWGLDYSAITPTMRKFGQQWWGMPFITFQILALPRIIEATVTRPFTILKWYLVSLMIAEYARRKMGIAKEKMDQITNDIFPGWMQEGYYIPFPKKDKYDQYQFLDLSYVIPYIQDFKAMDPKNYIFQNPAAQYSAAFITNRDPFLGTEIHRKEIDPSRTGAVKSFAKYLYGQIVPPLAPGAFNWEKIAKSIHASKDLTLQERGIQVQSILSAVADSIFGIKLRPIDVDAQRMKRLKELQSEFNAVSNEMKNVYSGNYNYLRYSDEQKEKKINELQDRLGEIMKRANEIKNINPKDF